MSETTTSSNGTEERGAHKGIFSTIEEARQVKTPSERFRLFEVATGETRLGYTWAWSVDGAITNAARVEGFADNDTAGRNSVDDEARHLLGAAASIRVTELPGVPEKGDVSNWLDMGGTSVSQADPYDPDDDGEEELEIGQGDRDPDKLYRDQRNRQTFGIPADHTDSVSVARAGARPVNNAEYSGDDPLELPRMEW